MRYVVLKKIITLEEKKSRKKFIEKATNLFFIPFDFEDGIEYKSIPSSAFDCLFIVGHNTTVKNYLLNNNISEKNIVIVSCEFKLNKDLKKNKKIYVSYDNNGKTNYYDGKEWGFHFYISKEELKLINSSGTFIDRVKKIFGVVNDG